MNWIVAVGIVALASLILSTLVLLLLARRNGAEALPDGDYVVTVVSTHETPQGVATVFRVEGPKEFEGQTVTIVKEKQDA